MKTNPTRYLELFLDEALAHLTSARSLVVRLETHAGDGAVHELYRHAHSLKGLASTMGFRDMTRLAHDAEDVLEQLGCGVRSLPEAVSELLDVLHAIERLVEDVDSRSDIPAGDRRPAVVRLDSILPRLRSSIDDVAEELGKRVELAMDGGDLLLRRGALGSIAVALIHLIRNAVDHGIECADERRAKGKSDIGRVWIGAEGSADGVVVVVEDDGRGLDIAAVRRCAVRRGLLPVEQARELDDDGAHLLATRPGLTTREHTSQLSGRGFGLAVVRADVEAMGGRVVMGPRPEGGTRVEMRLPARLSADHPRGQIAS